MNSPAQLPSLHDNDDEEVTLLRLEDLIQDDSEEATVPDALPLLHPRLRLLRVPEVVLPDNSPNLEPIDLRDAAGWRSPAPRAAGQETVQLSPLLSQPISNIPPAIVEPRRPRTSAVRTVSSFALGAVTTAVAAIGIMMIRPSPASSAAAAPPQETATILSQTPVAPAVIDSPKAVATSTPASGQKAKSAVQVPRRAPVQATAQSLATQPPQAEPEPARVVAPDPEPTAVPLDKRAAADALQAAAGAAANCRDSGDPAAVVRVVVTLAPSGQATQATVEGPPFAGTKTGGCVARAFRSVRVNPFSGPAVTLRKSFWIQ